MILMLAYAPKPHEAIVTDDDNPRQLPVFHSQGTDAPGHRCLPRILAICCICREQFNLCDATSEDVDRLKDEAWRCEDHDGR